MSMNFGREQSLLRQRLGAAASAEVAAASPGPGNGITRLGAPAAAIAAAATDLLANHPQMGRAQMTAFVRTLWQSKILELRAVGVAVLAARVQLLEAADLPVVEKLLGDAGPLGHQLGAAVIGPLVARHKKLWKDLERLASTGEAPRRTAAIAACGPVVAAQPDGFARTAKLLEKLLPTADQEQLAAVDGVLVAAAAHAGAAAREFAQRHGRPVTIPNVAPPAPTEPADGDLDAATAAAPQGRLQPPSKAARGKPAAGKSAAGKSTARKPAVVQPTAARSTKGGTVAAGPAPAARPKQPAAPPSRPAAKPVAKKVAKKATKKPARRG